MSIKWKSKNTIHKKKSNHTSILKLIPLRDSNIIDKYNRAQKHYNNRNYKRARILFQMIVFELSASDSDSMSDMHICNSSEDYLERIAEKGFWVKYYDWVAIALFITIILIYIRYK